MLDGLSFGFFVLFSVIFKTMHQAVLSCEISHYLIKTSIHSSPDAKNWLIGKDPDAGKD